MVDGLQCNVRHVGSAGEGVLADAEWSEEFLKQHFGGWMLRKVFVSFLSPSWWGNPGGDFIMQMFI